MDLRTTGQCSRKIGQRQISPGATDLFPGTPRNGKKLLKYLKFIKQMFCRAGNKYIPERNAQDPTSFSKRGLFFSEIGQSRSRKRKVL